MSYGPCEQCGTKETENMKWYLCQDHKTRCADCYWTNIFKEVEEEMEMVENTEAHIDMDNLLEEWAEKHHNNFEARKEVEKLWNQGVQNMCDQWSE